ncbi:putative bifunctional diguanylate cyclase/phosphodiesterase [Longivirga aurantiaca]|uniref:Bifunctional diguanylate cyclase/phosphodiesterase n=1 Tax=Longivirga aurantiaca TaxID=1837743 RepID=A0ABW1SZ85_9ACTN
MGSRARPSLLRWSLFAVTWQVSVWLGWGLILLAALLLDTNALFGDYGWQLAMIAALAFLGELRPVIASDFREAEGVPISATFVFAALYLWGFAPAVILQALAILLSEMVARKDVWKLMFNVGQYVISLVAAWVVLAWGGVTGLAFRPDASFQPRDLAVLIVAWWVFHLVNVTLVAGLARENGQTWWESFSEDWWFYAFSTLTPLAISPFVAVMAYQVPIMLPLLLVPLFAVYRTAAMARDSQHQALHDALTNLPNRVYLESRATQALDEARQQQDTVALFLLDLDRFKEVNDTLGHPAGDALLEVVARRLISAVRPIDVVARLGGDEFAVLLTDVEQPTDAIEVAGRVRAALAEPVRLEGVLMDVDVSIGIALSPVHGHDFEQLMRRADVAMYVAKGEGTGIELYDAARDPNSPARLGTVSALREGIEQGQLELHYQPKVSLRDGTVVGVEALVRWQHPERGIVPPDEFIPLAERTGLVHQITAHVLREGLGQARLWWDLGLQVPIAVNVSMRDLHETDLAGLVVAELDRHGLPPDAIVLEVTESVLVLDAGRAVATLRELRELGVSASLDDFGTGYSSLLLLEQLPVDEVKIDRSFVRRLDEEGGDPAMVRSIVDFAHGLGLSVVAEGLETSHAWRLLREFGCDVAQGYRISRPMPSDQATQWLVERVVRGPAERAGLRAVGSARIVADI